MLVTVGRYSFPYEAHIARALLESEGIPAFVADEHTVNMQWLYSDALGGVRLQVPEVFAGHAMALLQEEREEALVEEQGAELPPCPHCGSKDTEFYQFGRGGAFLAFLLLNFPLFPVKSGIRCRQCGKRSKS